MKVVLFIIAALVWYGCESSDTPTRATVEPVRGSIRSMFKVQGNSSETNEKLDSPFPNPFNRQFGDTTVALSFTIIEQALVKLIIQNPIGDSVAVFIDDSLNAGNFSYSWAPVNSLGEPLNPGLYFITLRVDPDKRNYIDSKLFYLENND